MAKRLYLLPLFFSLFFLSNGFGQEIKLIISSKNSIENNTLNNLKLNQFVTTKNDLIFKIDSVTNQLQLKGYLNLGKSIATQNDSVTKITYNLGDLYQKIKITIPDNDSVKLEIENLLKSKILNDTFEINTSEVPSLFNKLTSNFEQKGKTFIQFSLKNIELENDFAIAELFVQESNLRHVDKIVVKGYELFPKSFIKHRLHIKKNTIFNTKKLNEISSKIKSVSFAEEIKVPQTLFTKDATHVYLYLKKKNANKFDGLIGFNSKENANGVEFNGYLDLHLENMFNYGAKIDLLWKSNGNENQKFNLGVKTPYLFNSAFSPKGLFQLYKQDSTYINIKTQLEIEYTINSKNSISISIQNETSNNLLKTTSINAVKNYKTTYYGLHYYFQSFSDDDLFPIKYSANINSYFGNRTSDKIKTSQTKLEFLTFYNWKLNYKNYIYTQLNSGYLISDNYLDNELFRIGGNKTLRGFNEESVFASLYNTVNIEYRYLTKNNSYLYTITDFGLVENESAKNKLFAFGLGYAFNTKIGLLNLNYALGKLESQNFDFSKGVVGLRYVGGF